MKSLNLCKSSLKAFLHSRPLANIPVSENVKSFPLHGFKLMLGHFRFLFLFVSFCLTCFALSIQVLMPI